MATKKNKSLQQTPPQSTQKRDDEKQEVITPDLILPSSANVPLINAEIVQILIKENNDEEIERLMKADLNYNEKRLAIIRQHAARAPRCNRSKKNSPITAHAIYDVIGFKCSLGAPNALCAVTDSHYLWYNRDDNNLRDSY